MWRHAECNETCAGHHSESDTSSLNSMELQGQEHAQLRLSPKKRASLPAFNQPGHGQDPRHASGGSNNNMSMGLDPSCQVMLDAIESLQSGMFFRNTLLTWFQEIVSGSVTMVTLEGNVVAGQLSKLQDEISKLKVDKLELLRQNVAAQREVKR